MNCPSRPDNIEAHPDWNQNPSSLSADLTTRADLNGIVNLRTQRDENSDLSRLQNHDCLDAASEILPNDGVRQRGSAAALQASLLSSSTKQPKIQHAVLSPESPAASQISLPPPSPLPRKPSLGNKITDVLVQYCKFVGPGFLIAVAYIDPGNYATDVGAGAQTQYAHLFIVFMSNVFAIFLQALCIKLGSVTGLDLGQNCRRHLPKWLNWLLYLMAEAAIIATDVAEVIGTAIALNLLLRIPLVAGCAVSLIDVFVLMVFYNPDGSMSRLRIFEYFVVALVLGVLICFCIQLSYIQHTTVGEVFKGYLPSAAVIDGDGIYLSCGILGATVMPHSIFLGSGVVQPRLRQFDVQNGYRSENDIKDSIDSTDLDKKYRPSIHAIRTCLKYSIAELTTSLFTFALFINSAILIVAGASLYGNQAAQNADLFGIYDLLKANLSTAAAVLFALALLLSGTSAGIVCTMAGQMVSEGMINWTVRPWVRRLATRTISIVPSIVIAAAIGKSGLNAALTASQVVLSVILPFVTAPLLWFTCRSRIMTVKADENDGTTIRDGDRDLNNELEMSPGPGREINMRNGWLVTLLAGLIWLVLVVMNVALLVLVGLGDA